MYISNKIPDDIDAAGSGTIFSEPHAYSKNHIETRIPLAKFVKSF